MDISVDIGTSYSSICILGPDEKIHPVDISTGTSMFGSKYSLPTAVFVEDNGKLLFGQAAMNSRKKRPQNFRMEFKRDFGENIPILLGGHSFRPEELYTELFRHMKDCAEKVGGEPVERAYLTCPASYSARRKERLCTAAKAAGLYQTEVVDEPTSAAMYYCAEGFIQEGQTLLVYDFGGGTFDVSLVRYQDKAFQLLAEPEGLEQCGGVDMDRMIYQDMLNHIDSQILQKLQANEQHYMLFDAQLCELAVKAKHHLSTAEVFDEGIQVGFEVIPYQLTVEHFNEMIASLVGQTIQSCRQMLSEAKLSDADLSAVLLVGGSSRVPLVQEMTKRIAPSVPVLCAADLELAVVQGPLVYYEQQRKEHLRQQKEAEEEAAKEQARREAEQRENARREAEQRARQEAEQKAREEQLRKETELRVRQEEQARRKEEERIRQEKEAKERQEAAEKAKQAEQERILQEEEERARIARQAKQTAEQEIRQAQEDEARRKREACLFHAPCTLITKGASSRGEFQLYRNKLMVVSLSSDTLEECDYKVLQYTGITSNIILIFVLYLYALFGEIVYFASEGSDYFVQILGATLIIAAVCMMIAWLSSRKNLTLVKKLGIFKRKQFTIRFDRGRQKKEALSIIQRAKANLL